MKNCYFNLDGFKIEDGSTFLKTNLIVIPHSVYNQWKEYLSYFPNPCWLRLAGVFCFQSFYVHQYPFTTKTVKPLSFIRARRRTPFSHGGFPFPWLRSSRLKMLALASLSGLMISLGSLLLLLHLGF